MTFGVSLPYAFIVVSHEMAGRRIEVVIIFQAGKLLDIDGCLQQHSRGSNSISRRSWNDATFIVVIVVLIVIFIFSSQHPNVCAGLDENRQIDFRY